MDCLFYQSQALYCRVSEDKREYFYEDGTLKTLELYQNGKREGETILYWPNGRLKRKCHFVQGVRHGLDQMWNEEGILVDEGSYERGKAIDIHCRYGKLGNKIEEIEYLDAHRFNIRQWGEQGELRLEALWVDTEYREKAWDRFEQCWVEKVGFWNGKKLVYV